MNNKPANARELFSTLLELPDDHEREALLGEVAADSPTLAQTVRELLRAHRKAEGGGFFVTTPAWLDGTPDGREESAKAPCEDAPGKEPSRVGRYKLLEKIGEGGMGVVYMAEQEEPVHRKVALKIIKLGMDTKQVVARFEAERQALAMMENPNIAKLLDAGVTQTGGPFFVMELVRGIPITKFCDENALSVRQRLELFIPVCQAIQHAHQKGVIHRDIKPSNVLVSRDGGRPHPMVIDFGVAKATNHRLTEKTLFTLFSQMVGTPAYMSPEQAEMSIHDVDTRSDVYSLGVLLYELLTGTTPFSAERLRSAGFAGMQKIIKEEEPQRPSTVMSQMDAERKIRLLECGIAPDELIKSFQGDLDWIVLKAIEKDRRRRYETANLLAMDVQRHLDDEPVEAAAPTLGYRLRKYARRHKKSLAAAAAVATALVAGTVLSLWQAVEAHAASDRESEQRKLADAARERAEEGERRAVAGERQQRQIAYASDMKAVEIALAEDNLGRATTLLERYIPDPGEEEDDLRGIEWRYLWQESRGDEIYTFEHDSFINSLTLSDDGRLMATSTFDGKVVLYDLGSRRLLRSFDGATPTGLSMTDSGTLSPDGRLVAAERMGNLTVWNADTGAIVFEDLNGDFRAPVAFSPDSRLLAVYTVSGPVVWDVNNWTPRRLGKTLGTWNNRFVFTPDGSRVIYQNLNNCVVWNLESGAAEREIELPSETGPTAFATDGTIVAIGESFGLVFLFDLESGDLLGGPFQPESSRVHSLAISPDGKTLASGGADQVIRLWDLETLSAKKTLRGHRDEIWELHFSADGRLLLSASKDGTIKLWRPWDSRRDHPQYPVPPKLLCRGFTEAGDVLRFTDAFAGAPERTRWTVPLGTPPVPRIDHYLELGPGQLTRVPRTDTEELVGATSVAPQSGQDQLLFGKPDGTVVISDGITTESIRIAEHRVQPLILSPSDRYILASAYPEGAETYSILWDRDTNSAVGRFAPEIPRSSTGRAPRQGFSPDERFLAYSGTSGDPYAVVLWNIQERRISATLHGHTWNVFFIEFSSDGKLLASAGWDGSCRLWDVEAGTPGNPHVLSGHRAGVTSVSYSADGRTLVTAGDDLTMKFWSIATGQEMLSLPLSFSDWDFFHIPVLSPDTERLLFPAVTSDGAVLKVVTVPTLEEIDRSIGASSRAAR